MVCPCTLYGVCVVCPGTSELVGQHWRKRRFSCYNYLDNLQKGSNKSSQIRKQGRIASTTLTSSRYKAAFGVSQNQLCFHAHLSQNWYAVNCCQIRSTHRSIATGLFRLAIDRLRLPNRMKERRGTQWQCSRMLTYITFKNTCELSNCLTD